MLRQLLVFAILREDDLAWIPISNKLRASPKCADNYLGLECVLSGSRAVCLNGCGGVVSLARQGFDDCVALATSGYGRKPPSLVGLIA